jgi:regulatory protein
MGNETISALRQKVGEIESRRNSLASEANTSSLARDQFSGSTDFDSLTKKDDTGKSIRWSAMDLLARREHSAKELTNKLLKRYPEGAQEIADCIAALSEDNLQSDSRFCESYVYMRKRKGYGPQRIAAELRDRGVSETMAKEELNNPEYDWFASLGMAWQKKFHGKYPQDLKDKVRQVRFLTYRGFYSSHIHEFLSE